MCMLYPSNISKYVKFYFHGILGTKGPPVTIFGDKSQELSWYTLTICINIPKIKNGKKMYYHLLLSKSYIIFFIKAR